jgi:hypothetical protein
MFSCCQVFSSVLCSNKTGSRLDLLLPCGRPSARDLLEGGASGHLTAHSGRIGQVIRRTGIKAIPSAKSASFGATRN